MEAYDLSHKLSYLGRRCAVPFVTGPEYTNSVPGVPVLSQVRLFVEPRDWSRDNILAIAREVARVLGPTEQFDIGITLARHLEYTPHASAAGNTARLTKLDRDDPSMYLRISEGNEDLVFRARFPGLRFEEVGEDFWRSIYAPGAVKATGHL